MKSRCDNCKWHLRLLYVGQAVTLLAIAATFLYSYYIGQRVKYGDERSFVEHVFDAANRHRRAPSDKNEKLRYSFEGQQEEHDELFQPKGDWILLPSYARVSIQALTKFCLSAETFCRTERLESSPDSAVVPQGPRGPPGPPGPPGKCECDVQTNNVGQSENVTQMLLEASQQATTAKGLQNDVSQQTEAPSNDATNLTTMDNNLTTVPPNVADASSIEQNSPSKKGKRRKHQKHSKHKLSARKFGKRKKRCVLRSVGEPELMGHRQTFMGAWMKDSHPRNEAEAQSCWVTDHFSGNLLLEFGLDEHNKPLQQPRKTHELPEMYDGTNHVVYNGSLYYQRAGTNHIIKYDIRNQESMEKPLPKAAYQHDAYIYGNNQMSYMDFAADENGLWVVYRKESRGYLMLSKLNPDTLEVQGEVRFHSLKSRHLVNTFMMCGTLYTIENGKKDSVLGWAHDVYTARMSYVNMSWHNAHGRVTMVDYNARDQRIYMYDFGHLVAVPVAVVELADKQPYTNNRIVYF